MTMADEWDGDTLPFADAGDPNIKDGAFDFGFDLRGIKVVLSAGWNGETVTKDIDDFNLSDSSAEDLVCDLIENAVGSGWEIEGCDLGQDNTGWGTISVYNMKDYDKIADNFHLNDMGCVFKDETLFDMSELNDKVKGVIANWVKEVVDDDDMFEGCDLSDCQIDYQIGFDAEGGGFVVFTDGSQYEW